MGECESLVVVKLVVVNDAVAATEVVYYASEKLDENAMHYEHRQQAPWGCGAIRPGGCVFLLLLLETEKRPRVTRERVTRWFGCFSSLAGGEWFYSL